MAQLGLPNDTFWKHEQPLVYACVILLAVVGIEEMIRRLAQTSTESRVSQYESDIHVILSVGLCQTAQKLSIQWDQIGVHAFLARGPRWRRRLVNIGGLRIGSRPTMSGPDWRRGKGVVGRAWEEQKPVKEEWQTYAEAHLSDGKAAWSQKPAVERYGLSWGELYLTREYVGIAAAPIFHKNGSVIGCVAIDGPITGPALRSAELEQILRDVARSINKLGRPPALWRGRA
jgi:hypothetical protein